MLLSFIRVFITIWVDMPFRIQKINPFRFPFLTKKICLQIYGKFPGKRNATVFSKFYMQLKKKIFWLIRIDLVGRFGK